LAQELEALTEKRAKILAALDEVSAGQRDDLEMQLDFLFRPGFLKTQDLFSRYPRYLKAMTVRIQRLCNNPDSDRKKLAEIEPFQNRLNEKWLACQESSRANDLLELAMLLEEFRINRCKRRSKSAAGVGAV